jgi:hypothetical protein
MPTVISTLGWGEDVEKLAAINNSSSHFSKKNSDEILFESSSSDDSSESSSSEDGVDDGVDDGQTSFLNDLFAKNKLNSDTKRIKEMLEKRYKANNNNNSSTKNKCNCSSDDCFDSSFCGEINSKKQVGVQADNKG